MYRSERGPEPVLVELFVWVGLWPSGPAGTLDRPVGIDGGGKHCVLDPGIDDIRIMSFKVGGICGTFGVVAKDYFKAGCRT